MNQETVAGKTVKNSMYSMVANIWYLLGRFLLTPFVLMHLPMDEYGLWTICFVVTSFLAMTSIGLEGVYIKYVADFHARGETEKINRLLSTGIICTTVLGILLMTGIWTGMDQIISLLNIEQHLQQMAATVLMVICLIFMLDISLSAFGRALDGLQYMYLTAKVRFVTSLVEIGCIIILLLAGFGIYGMMSAFLIRFILAIAINMHYAYQLIPKLVIRASYCDLVSLKLLLNYGGKLQLLGIIGIFMSTFDKLIITRFLGLTETGLYEIGRKIPATSSRIPTEVSGAIVPALADLQSRDELLEARSIFIGASRYICLIAAPLFTFFFAVAPYAIYVWLGEGYDQAAIVMHIIAAGTFVHLLTGSSSGAARGLNKLGWEIRYTLVNLILCLILVPLLTLSFGLAGAAAGTALGTGIASLYFIVVTGRHFQVKINEYCRNVIHPTAVCILSGTGLFILLPLIVPEAGGRLVTAAALCLLGALHLLLCCLLLFLSGGILEVERQWLRRKFTNSAQTFQFTKRLISKTHQ